MDQMTGKFIGLPLALKNQIEKVISAYPASAETFSSLIDYYESQNDNKRKKVGHEITKTDETHQKRNTSTTISLNSLEGTNIMLQLPDLSTQSPFRKRLNLVFGAIKGEKKAYLALTKSMESKPELLLRCLTPDNVKFAAILNVPEKKPLRYLLVEYISNDGNLYKNDPILVQFNNDILEEQFGSILGGKTFVQYLTSQLALVDFKVLDCSSNDDIFFVQSYKGNKEGYLYFLPNHVIFGFKKPIHIFNSTDIESITYTSITRLTFNVSLDVKVNGITEKYEFSMIDQKEFENIDKYVKTKDVRDNSMNEEHKAQKQLKNNTEMPGDLAQAAKLVPGGEQLISAGNGNADDDDDDDDDEDDNYQIGDSDDDHSDNSGHEDNQEEDGEEDQEDEEYYEKSDNNYTGNITFTPSTFGNVDTFRAFDENLQQELQDLQKDLDIDINELQKAGYIDM